MGVRALEPDDVSAVAALYERVVRSGAPSPPQGLVEYFRRFFIERAARRDEYPSFVYETEQGIEGFIGVHYRAMTLDDAPFHVVTTGPLFVDTETAAKGAGFLLLRASQALPHDLLLTDGANETMRPIWLAARGDIDHLRCMYWTRPLRLLEHSVAGIEKRPNPGWLRAALSVARPACRLGDRLIHGRVTRRFRRDTGLDAVPLTAERLAQVLARVGRDKRLRPASSVEDLAWYLDELGRIRQRGELRARLIVDAAREPVGAYIYYLGRDRVGQVVHVSAVGRAGDDVLTMLFQDADAAGALALRGRADELTVSWFENLRCRFDYTPPLALLKTPRPEVYSLLFSGGALLTAFEGEAWMGFAAERFE